MSECSEHKYHNYAACQVCLVEYWRNLYEKADKRIAELEADRLCRCADEVRCDMQKRIAELEARLDAVAKWLDDEWTLTEQQRQGCLKALEQEE